MTESDQQPAQQPRLSTEDLVALRNAAIVTLQQTIDTIAEGVRREKFAVSGLLEGRFREALRHLLMARDELT